MGTYCHGIFASTELRRALLNGIGARSAGLDHGVMVDAALDDIAQSLEQCLDIDAMIALARENRS